MALLIADAPGNAASKSDSEQDPEQAKQGPPHPDITAYYSKREYQIPMRDGAKLYTAVYTPKDQSTAYPILINRTPYSVGSYGPENFPAPENLSPNVQFLESKYIFVLQDIRGTYRSEGTFEVTRPPKPDGSPWHATDETTDTYDTIDWLLHNLKNHNGKVGQWGISYSGWTTLMGMLDAHPALKASSPQASPADMFIGDDWHHNGAFRLKYSFFWMSLAARERVEPTVVKQDPFEYGTPWTYLFHLNAPGSIAELNERYFDGKMTMWDEFSKHPNYDEYWQKRNFLQYLHDIDHPILNVAGWFDAEDFYGPISIYRTIEERVRQNSSTIVIGPWRHGGWQGTDGSSLGNINFGSKTSDFYNESVVFPFFEYHLKGKGEWQGREAIVFETGRNRWHTFDKWPPPGTDPVPLYLREDNRLFFDPPRGNDTEGADSYVSNPEKPIPYTINLPPLPGHPGHAWMIEDQRWVSTRPDVLVYRSDVLTEDVTVAGPVDVKLVVSSTGTDADFFVKLIDEFPGVPESASNPQDILLGHNQMLVAVEVMRAKYRNSFVTPEPLIPGKKTSIEFKLWDKMHTFKKGHRIMVQIHSTWFPAYDRNTQQFMNIYLAEKDDYLSATHTIHRDQDSPSHLVLPLLKIRQHIAQEEIDALPKQ